MEKSNNKKAISLIVLVITIIVMIVLAAAIILSLQSSGIIVRGNEAKTSSDVANAKQVVAMANAEWELMATDEQSQKGSFKVYAELKLEEAGLKVGEGTNAHIITEDGKLISSGENTIYKDIDGKYVVIPKGFTVSKYTNEDTVGEGLVIYKTPSLANIEPEIAETTYDQFVWVPVPNITDFIRTQWSNNAPTNIISKYYTEPSSYNASTASQYSTEIIEYNAMRTSVEKYGGFYIARYEAGDSDALSNRKTYTTGAHKVVSRRGAYVYNYVGWGTSMTDIASDVVDSNGNNRGKGAVYLSQNMYDKNNSYTTTLIYGVQWDAALRWLSDKYNVSDSRSWGNYATSTGDAATNSGSANMNYTTGRNDAWKAKNIYDLAGNVWEWTMEAVSIDSRVYRGGYYNHGGEDSPASSRSGNITYYGSGILGFRPTLYIN